jgi:hypothetical protein
VAMNSYSFSRSYPSNFKEPLGIGIVSSIASCQGRLESCLACLSGLAINENCSCLAAMIDVAENSTIVPKVIGFAAVTIGECFTVGFGIEID